MNRQRLQAIDVLRGLAALTVVLSHYFPHWDRYHGDVPMLVPGNAGYFAVKLFFVISGFVIFMTLERCSSVVDFVVLRFSRLYPAYWASLVLVTLMSVFVFGDSFWVGGFVTNATMLQQFLGYSHFDNVYWSLTVELAFYLHVAWLFALGLHRRPQVALLVWLCCAAIWVVATGRVGQVTASAVVDTTQRDWFALLLALDYAPYFTIGILFYRARRSGWTPAAAALIALAIAVEFLMASWEGVVIVVSAATLLAAAASGRLGFVVTPVSLWLGAISYSLYLAHRNLGHHALEWLHDKGVPGLAAIGIVGAGALLLATVVAYGVERPALAWLRNRYERGKTGATRALATPGAQGAAEARARHGDEGAKE